MHEPTIAYFSMEIALESAIPTYSGGLGALAGDTIRSAADLELPMVAVTLLHRKGYLYQRLAADGWQTEEPVHWVVEDFLDELPARVQVTIEGRSVQIRAWRYTMPGRRGHGIPVYLLDCDLPDNSAWDRTLTDQLYGGDDHYRLCQEVILGIGGIRMLRALDHRSIRRYHMNEGHAALLTLELLEETARAAGRAAITREDIDAVREACVFTTHTPVPAGHDHFPLDLVRRVLGAMKGLADVHDLCYVDVLAQVLDADRHGFETGHLVEGQEVLNTTYLALNLSHYVNGVARKHREVSRLMLGHYDIDSITNGVHAASWVSEPFQTLFDRHIPGWREDNFGLRYALGIPRAEVWEAHQEAKRRLVKRVNRECNSGLDEDVLTIGFARRAATYKRADLLFTDIERLRAIARDAGSLQIVYAGKAHPRDAAGKEVIKRVFAARAALAPDVRVAYLANYDLELAGLMTAGADLWLNTPQPPNEASGTSGMKAALNGVPSFSTLDGWWLEGHIEGATGWAIGTETVAPGLLAPGAGVVSSNPSPGSPRASAPRASPAPDDAQLLYDKLERVIIPLFHEQRPQYQSVMRQCIALNGAFFNTQRMVQQYVVNAYL